jgi:hypothetical protein
MADLKGTSSIDIDAPIPRCFVITADVESAPVWQGAMRGAQAVEYDAQGRAALVEAQIHAIVAEVTVWLLFTYTEPTGMRWTRERGELKSLTGAWDLEDLGGGQTRAAYSLEIGLNRALGLLRMGVRGPAETKARELLTQRPVALSTSGPESGVPFTITFSGTDTPFNEHGNTPFLYALVRRENGVPCQPTYGQDLQVAGTDDASVVYNEYTNPNPVSDGSFTYPVTFTPVTGAYIICSWLETDSGDVKGKGDVASEVVTATATGNYTIVRPKPACVIPSYRGATLRTTETRLRASHCEIGVVRHARDRHVKRGRVIKLSDPPGHHYLYGTKVAITVSRG